MHLNEIIIISGNDSILLYKSFRLDTDDKSKDVFLQTLKNKGPNLPPHFECNGKYFYSIKRGGLYLVATSGHEVSPVMVIEILSRLYSILKDFCGTVNEDSLMANNLLLMEILNEFVDFGYVQTASTEKIKPYIQSQPVMVKQTREPTSDITSRLFGIETKVSPNSSTARSVVSSPISQDSKNSELFVDIIERLTGVINANGTAARIEVSGCMKMKNFINGSPQIKIGLNEGLTILEGRSKAYGNHVQLDKCNFHQCVKLEEFEHSKVMTVIPPPGEFSVMTYSTNDEIALNVPFRVMAFLEDAENSRDKLLTIRLKNDLPSNYNAVKVSFRVNIPHSIDRISQQLNEPDQTAELDLVEHQIVWTIKRFPGRAEYIAYFRLINDTCSIISKEDIGPALMDFEISGFTSSGLQIKFLKVQEMGKKSNLKKWIRFITVSDSYLIKLW